MIDIKLYEKNIQFQKDYQKNLKNRKEDQDSLNKVMNLYKTRKQLIQLVEQSVVDRKKLEKHFFSHSEKKNNEEEKKKFRNQAKNIAQRIDRNKQHLKEIESEIKNIFSILPNMCHSSVPIGDSSQQNQQVKKEGTPSFFSFPIRSHLELAGYQIDSQRAAKVSGARFCFLRGEVAQLERALANYMINTHVKKHGYEELYTPLIVHQQALFHTGQLPKFEQDVFLLPFENHSTDKNLSDTRSLSHKRFLIPTAEVPSTNFFSNEILPESSLPIRFVTYSACFRSEAGSYGKDVKGLIRQHQFTKVELVTFSHPDRSYEELERLRSCAEQILKDLELPYQVMNLCTGDIGFSAAKCYDLEVWLPSEKKYREISSCSNCESYQARRGNIRFRSQKGSRFVHTLNGSGLAVGRTLIAVLENYQNEDGSVRIPSILRPYMDNKSSILLKK